jgi:hypothetical protein
MLRRFAGVIRASCRGTGNLDTLRSRKRFSQISFATGDAKPVRDIMRDLERVNRGEPGAKSDPFLPFESQRV